MTKNVAVVDPRAEQASLLGLAQSEDLVRRLMECSGDRIEILDLDGFVLWTSQTAGRASQAASAPAVRALMWADSWPEPSRKAAREALAAARAGRSDSFHSASAPPNATPKLWDVTVTSLRGPDGRRDRLLAHSRDITQEISADESLAFLADASKVLTTSLNVQETLDALVQLVVPGMADWAVINLLGKYGVLTARAVAHADAKRVADAQRLLGHAYLKPGTLWGAAYEPGSRGPRIIPRAGNDFLASTILTRYLPLVKRLGRGSMMMLSLESNGRVLGSLTAVSTNGRRRYGPADSPLFQELARRAATAIDHAQQHENSQRIAHVFQQASLPESLPAVDGIAFHATYIPAQTDVNLGGDWYDVFRVPDGRIVLSIGDVCGSGVDAAVIMCKVRQTLRSVAMLNTDTTIMLEVADRMVKLDYPYGMVTALVGIIDPKAVTFTWQAAGHPGPLFRYCDRTIAQGFGCGLPLGLREDDEVKAQTVLLPQGTLVMCYTDGLIESTRDIFEGERRLRAALCSDRVVDSDNPAKAIHDLVLHDGARDDVAILIAAVAAQTATGFPRWTFDTANASAAQSARRTVVEYAQARAQPGVDLSALELIFGELIGNAVKHAPGGVEVALEWAEADLVLHVSDGGAGFELGPLDKDDPLSESGRGLFIAAALAKELAVTRSRAGGAHVRAVVAVG
ncbi:MAG: SpoIIE family protein phosphatase [Candidatus Eremiobacteraeota bacterium]|nr:SpoIIE family protein phosphatase [Candidatus Eremiobacteraeota bacterium]